MGRQNYRYKAHFHSRRARFVARAASPLDDVRAGDLISLDFGDDDDAKPLTRDELKNKTFARIHKRAEHKKEGKGKRKGGR